MDRADAAAFPRHAGAAPEPLSAEGLNRMLHLTRRRTLALAGSALPSPVAASLATPAIARPNRRPVSPTTEILLGQTMPYSGPASSYAPIGRVEVAYLDMINDKAVSTAARSSCCRWMTATARRRRSSRPASWSRRKVSPASSSSLARPARRRRGNTSTAKQGAADLRRLRCHAVRRSAELSLDHRLAGQLPDRGPRLRPFHSGDETRRQDRDAVSE